MLGPEEETATFLTPQQSKNKVKSKDKIFAEPRNRLPSIEEIEIGETRVGPNLKG